MADLQRIFGEEFEDNDILDELRKLNSKFIVQILDNQKEIDSLKN